MIPREACPQCGSTWYKRNGHIHTGKQNHRCSAVAHLTEYDLELGPQGPLIQRTQGWGVSPLGSPVGGGRRPPDVDDRPTPEPYRPPSVSPLAAHRDPTMGGGQSRAI
jgi:hypothetical protein